MSKEKFIWDIVSEILENHGDMVDDISIHEHEECGEEFRKIYCSKGYCFELIKKEADEEPICDTEDGFVYSFTEPWDDFVEAGAGNAIDILNNYAGISYCKNADFKNAICKECTRRMALNSNHPLPDCYKE